MTTRLPCLPTPKKEAPRKRTPWPPAPDAGGLLPLRDIQACLRALGRYDGPLDGRARPCLTAAIQAYQTAERPRRTGSWRTDGSIGPVFCDGLVRSLAGVDRPPWYGADETPDSA